MAELENWSEAIFAFEEALKLNLGFAEAQHNIIQIRKLIPEKRKIELVTPQSLEDKMYGKSEELDQESDEKGPFPDGLRRSKAWREGVQVPVSNFAFM